MFSNIKEILLYKFHGLRNTEMDSLVNYLMSRHSRNLKSLILPHLNYDSKMFIDFCKVFERDALSLTSLIIERINFDEIKLLLTCL
jgi:hypothetical protein